MITSHQKTNNLFYWRGLFNLTVLSACFYALMEWLFFATKPSSLSILSPFDSLKVLFVTAGTISLVAIALLVCLSLPAGSIRRGDWRSHLSVVAGVVPALLLSITALILFDNFTYTTFKFGIVSTKGWMRIIYALAFSLFFWRMLVFARQALWAGERFTSYLAIALLTTSLLSVLAAKLASDLDLNRAGIPSARSSASYPNIIVLGSDGLSARYLTVYNPQLETTPFLSTLARNSLVAENAFPNAGGTTASTTSALTGKEPIVDRVYHYPDILSGRDSFEHLPGILRQRGYRTVEIGTPYYVDAQRLNLLEGFDIANNQSRDTPASNALRALLGNSPSTYFIQTILERAGERLLHIFLIKEMQNPLAEVKSSTASISDEQRVDQIIDLLDHADRPVFIFAHLMDTHGPEFSFREEVFSTEASSGREWDMSRYENALLSFDDHVQRIYEHLAETGQLDHTVLVVYTDHGFKYAIHERIPLIIHFPKNANAGTRRSNVQIIDIPVTLLDYLHIPTPGWMSGTSVLTREPSATRQIISIGSGSPKEVAPPFYQINIVQIIVCQNWYALNVRENSFASGIIADHTAKCAAGSLPADEEVHQRILEYLQKHGYDISSLE